MLEETEKNMFSVFDWLTEKLTGQKNSSMFHCETRSWSQWHQPADTSKFNSLGSKYEKKSSITEITLNKI